MITLDGFQHFLFGVGSLAFRHGRRHQHTQRTVLNYDLDRQATNIFTVRIKTGGSSPSCARVISISRTRFQPNTLHPRILPL